MIKKLCDAIRVKITGKKEEEDSNDRIANKSMELFFQNMTTELQKQKKCPPDQMAKKECLCMRCPVLGECQLEIYRAKNLNCSYTYVTHCGRFDILTGGQNVWKETEGGEASRGVDSRECSHSNEVVSKIP